MTSFAWKRKSSQLNARCIVEIGHSAMKPMLSYLHWLTMSSTLSPPSRVFSNGTWLPGCFPCAALKLASAWSLSSHTAKLHPKPVQHSALPGSSLVDLLK